MSSQTRSCYICSDDKSLCPVFLPDKQEILVGRSVDTKIADPQCSRKQVRFYANYDEHKVFFKQLGNRPCGFNGYKTIKGEQYTANHGDLIEILYGRLPYKIEFNPPPKVKVESENLKKRLLSQESEEESQELLSTKKSKVTNNTDTCLNMEESTSKKRSEESGKKNSASTSFSNFINQDKIEPSIENGAWEHFGNKTLYVYTSSDCKGRSKIAAYDMDKTLIKTISGLQLPIIRIFWKL